MGLRVTAENLISDCNELLKLTSQIKKMLLVSDFEQINQEIEDQNMK